MGSNKMAEELARFRFGLIAPVLNDLTGTQRKYFLELTKKSFQVPGKDTRQNFSLSTFKAWLANYKSNGFDALYPNTRSDKGQVKCILDETQIKIKKIIEDLPDLSCSGIYRKMIKEGLMNVSDFSAGTLRHYVRTHKLRENIAKIPRQKFETAQVHQLWLTDFMHGPHICDANKHNKKRKTYLLAIIDDHSRFIMGARFFWQENKIALATLLKDIFLQYGVPLKLYCDNGSAFSSDFLILICARLGLSLIHSKPYDSPSRGKIERYNGSVRTMFLAANNLNDCYSLEALNLLFQTWLHDEYHQKLHSSTDQKPIDRYFHSLKNISVRHHSKEELDLAFQNTFTRNVRNDATISVDNVFYEVPAEFIGCKVELRYPIDDKTNLTLYQDGRSFKSIKPVNLIENAEKPALKIKFIANIEKLGDIL